MCVGKLDVGGGVASPCGSCSGEGALAGAEGGAAEGTTNGAVDGGSAPPLCPACASAASASAETTASQPAPRMFLDGVPPFEHDQDHDQREQHHARQYRRRQPRQVVVLEPPSTHEVATGNLSFGAAETSGGDEVLDAGHVRLLDVDHPGG